MNAQSLPLDAGHDELLQVVARIRARKASQALLAPAPAVLAAIVAHLRDEEPLTAEELYQYEREWRAVEDELRAVEWNDMHKERWI
jgi:hypothetical protein